MAQISMGKLVITFILIIIGLSLTPAIGDLVFGTQHNATGTGPGNLTGVSPVAASLVSLVTFFWILIVLAVGIVSVYLQLKGVG